MNISDNRNLNTPNIGCGWRRTGNWSAGGPVLYIFSWSLEDNISCRTGLFFCFHFAFLNQFLTNVCRPPFQLRTPLIVWNFLLAIFSIFGAARTIPEFIFTLSTHGIYHSLCVPRYHLTLTKHKIEKEIDMQSDINFYWWKPDPVKANDFFPFS